MSPDIDKRDSYGKTALHCAVSAGHVGTVKYLLHCHANPNVKDHREEAPLHAAVRTGNVEMVEVIYIYIYILLDVLFCSITQHFYELCRILANP